MAHHLHSEMGQSFPLYLGCIIQRTLIMTSPVFPNKVQRHVRDCSVNGELHKERKEYQKSHSSSHSSSLYPVLSGLLLGVSSISISHV